MDEHQMDTDGFTGHAPLRRHAKRRFRKAAEAYCRIVRDPSVPTDNTAQVDAFARMMAAYDFMVRT